MILPPCHNLPLSSMRSIPSRNLAGFEYLFRGVSSSSSSGQKGLSTCLVPSTGTSISIEHRISVSKSNWVFIGFRDRACVSMYTPSASLSISTKAASFARKDLTDSSTTLLVMMRWTGRQNEAYDSQGKQVEWTGNQCEQVERMVKYVTRNKQQKIWVVFETQQTGSSRSVRWTNVDKKSKKSGHQGDI